MARKCRCDRCKVESSWSTDGFYYYNPKGWNGYELRSGSNPRASAAIILCEQCSKEIDAFFMPSSTQEPQLSQSEKLVAILNDIMYDVASDASANRGT